MSSKGHKRPNWSPVEPHEPRAKVPWKLLSTPYKEEHGANSPIVSMSIDNFCTATLPMRTRGKQECDTAGGRHSK